MPNPDNSGWPDAENQGVSRRFIHANGLNFEIAQSGDASSPKLALCLHGFPELNYSWRFQMPVLAKRGWRVWAPNLRGYGESDKPDGVRAYALDHLLADVAAMIDAANKENPVKEVMLVAHDWGAVIAWHFAILKLRKIDRLVIMNVPHPKIAEREIFKWRQIWKSWYMFYFQLRRLPESALLRKDADRIRKSFTGWAIDKTNFPPEVLDVFARAAQRPGAMTAMINYYRALFKHRDTVNIGDGNVDIPTLLLWGEEDRALNIRCSEGTEQWVPDLQLRRFPGVSHWVQQEAPDKVNAAIMEWLSR